MPRYGRFKYGAAKYGADDALTGLRWGFEVDWDGDGEFNGSNDAFYLTHLMVDRGREFMIQPRGNGLEIIRPGTFTAVLENVDGRYDPYNESGPLYGNLMPGRKVRIRVKDMSDGTVYPIFLGSLLEPEPAASYDGNPTVTLRGVDYLQYLGEQTLLMSLYSSQTVATVLGAILTAVGWEHGSSIEDNGDDMPYWWAERGTTALEAIQFLAEAFLGTAFCAADGTFKYYSRSHDPTPLAAVTQAMLLKDIRVPQYLSMIRNYITYEVRPRRSYTTVELWRLNDIPQVLSGETIQIWADYSYNGEDLPGANVTTPVATTDYTMNTLANGSGTNLTASFTVTATKYGTTTLLTVTNGSASDGYITLLKLRGDALSGANVSSVIAEETTSQGRYGVKRLTISRPELQEVLVASDLANYLVDSLFTPTPFPVVQIENRPSLQFGADLFDKAPFEIDGLGIDDTFAIGGIRHEWLGATGQGVRTMWRLEKAVNIGDYWTFPTLIGTTSRFGF